LGIVFERINTFIQQGLVKLIKRHC